MNFGVVVLLDALGVRNAHKWSSIVELAERWDKVDIRIEHYSNRLRDELGSHGYNNDVRMEQPYDNIQVFIPVRTIGYCFSNNQGMLFSPIYVSKMIIPV
jgi:hypothetical protein